jgi:hypothetical protein
MTMSEQHSNGEAGMEPAKHYDAPVAEWILEKYAGQWVAVTHDGQTVLAANPKGAELIKQLDREGHDRASYFLQRIYPANSILVL